MTNSTLRVLIVDDEALAADRLSRLCARLEGLEIAGVAADGKAALSLTEKVAPDVVLLDISMPELDGMALARALIMREQRPAIIFVTAHSHYAVAAFELAATDYLLKPVSLSRLDEAVGRVRNARPPLAPPPCHLTELWAPRGHAMVRLGVETLDLLEAERDYVRLHARGQAYLLRETLRNLELRLDPERFVRLHRSTIVPISRISALQRRKSGGWTVELSTGGTVRVGRSFQSSVRRIRGGLDRR